MKLAQCLLALGVVVFLGCGTNTFPPSSDWITFNSPDAPYSVLLPSQPKRQVQSSDGVDVILHLCEINKDLGVITGSNDMPAELDLSDKEQIIFILDEGIQGATSAMKAKVKEQKDFLLDGKYPCRECTASISISKSNTGVVRLRYVLIPKKLIQVMVIGDDAQMSAPQVTKCLESIKIKM